MPLSCVMELSASSSFCSVFSPSDASSSVLRDDDRDDDMIRDGIQSHTISNSASNAGVPEGHGAAAHRARYRGRSAPS